MSVILSGVAASRSEAATQSKDPGNACSGNSDARHFHHDFEVQRRELPDGPVAPDDYTGSFDCVALRSANGNSAQDDRV